MEYEVCYLIGESKELDLDRIRTGVEDIIKKHKGNLIEGEFVRKRRLSYEIKREARGTYVAKRFTVPNKDEKDELYPDYDFIGEINKELNFNQDVLRFMIVKTDELLPLQDLEKSEALRKEQSKTFEKKESFNKDFKRPERVVAPKQVEVKKEEPKVEEVKEVKEVVAPKEEVVVKETVSEKVQEVEAEVEAEEKPKKKSKKEEKNILGDDIDEKLDEILNI